MDQHLSEEIWCPHLYLVGDAHCRLCLRPVRGTELTDQNDDGIDWGDMQPPAAEQPSPVATTPQWEPSRPNVSYPDNGPLAEAPISINFRVTGEPQITVRGFHGADITAILQDLSDNGVWANIAAAQADLRGQGQLGAGLGPMTPVPPAQPAPGPQGPPFGPNVSVPSAPGYMGPQPGQFNQPPQQNWGGQAPPQGGFNGGGGQQSGRAQPKPQPPGWFRVNARTGPGFDAWKQWREANKDNLKGKIQWGDKSDYWIEPSLAQYVAQMGYAVTP